MVVPNELNACAKFNRLDAFSGEPKTEMYGLAATCKMVIPPATTNNANQEQGIHPRRSRRVKEQTAQRSKPQTSQNSPLVANALDQVSSWNAHHKAVGTKPSKLNQSCLQQMSVRKHPLVWESGHPP